MKSVDCIWYTLRKRWLLLSVMLVLMLLVSLVTRPMSENPNVEWFDAIDSVIGLVTLGVALMMWLGDQWSHWKSIYPKG